MAKVVATAHGAADGPRWWRGPIVLVMALGLFAVGCAGSEGDDDGDAVVDRSTSTATPEDTESDGAESDGTESEATEEDEPEEATDDGPSDPVVDRLLTLTDDAETSQTAPGSGEAPIAVYDRFELDDDIELAAVRWEGFYCRLVEDGPAPEPTASAFVVAIVGGDTEEPDPDDVIAQSTVDVTEADEVLRASVERPCGAVATTVSFFGYEAALDAPVPLTADGPYWLSIQAVTSDFGTYWAWRGASGDDGTSVRRYDGTSLEVFGDRAFALVPSPS